MSCFTTVVWNPAAQDHVSVEVDYRIEDIGVMISRMGPVVYSVKDAFGKDLLLTLEDDDKRKLERLAMEHAESQRERARFDC